MPSPATNCSGCLHAELRYDSAFSMENVVWHLLQVDNIPIFSRISTAFRTPTQQQQHKTTSRRAAAVWCFVMFRVAGKVPRSLMTERWHLGRWLGKRFHTEEHGVARTGAASKADPTYRDRVERAEQRKISRQVLQNAGSCREMSIPIRVWHTQRIVASELRQGVRQTRRIVIDLIERAEQRKKGFHAKEVERMDHARRASLEASVVPRPPAEEIEVEDRSSVREAKRAREEPAQDLSGEIPIPSADKTLTNPVILAVPSSVIPSSSIPIQISPGASSSSGVKRTYSESTAVPNVPGVSSTSGRILFQNHRNPKLEISTEIQGLWLYPQRRCDVWTSHCCTRWLRVLLFLELSERSLQVLNVQCSRDTDECNL